MRVHAVMHQIGKCEALCAIRGQSAKANLQASALLEGCECKWQSSMLFVNFTANGFTGTLQSLADIGVRASG